MATLSDLLGIDHFTTSRGGTVRRDFLEAAGGALGLSQATIKGLATKEDVLAAMVEAANREPMNPDLLSVGGTITNEALQAIIDGVTRHGIPTRVDLKWDQPVEEEDDFYADLDDFDPAMFKDERDRKLVKIALREGQDHFRSALLEAYGGRCAVTGYDAPETLEAAHIYPHKGPATNRVSNGLLLRADVHKLFDRGALSIHETSHRILIKPHLAVTEYEPLGRIGQRLRLPKQVVHRPSVAALRSHREWAGM